MNSIAATKSGRTLPRRQKTLCPRCGASVLTRRVADYLVRSCTTGCGYQESIHDPRTPVFHLGVPPGSALSQEALLDATDRDLETASHIDRVRYLRKQLLAMFDAGIEVDTIKRELQYTGTDVELHLGQALTAASGRNPRKLVTDAPDGSPGRISWVDDQGRLWHRPFDGSFPRGYPKAKAIQQCREVLLELLHTRGNTPKDRALAMLYMAEVGLHTFDTDDGRRLYGFLNNLGLDDEAKKRRIAESYERPEVSLILQQRCGFVYCWYDRKIRPGRHVRPALRRSR